MSDSSDIDVEALRPEAADSSGDERARALSDLAKASVPSTMPEPLAGDVAAMNAGDLAGFTAWAAFTHQGA